MKPITPAQLQCINVICTKNKIDADSKAAMVNSYSAAGHTSSKDLLINEAASMIKRLKELYGTGEDARNKAMLGKIFYYAHEMGWTKVSKVSNKKVADVQAIDDWMKKYSYLKKKLNKYTFEELPKLVSQFEMVYKSHLNRF